MGEINSRELSSNMYHGYRAGDFVGKVGIERAYESFLRGAKGGRQVKVNAVGQVVSVLRTVALKPGSNLSLTIDKQLQEHAESLIAGKAGVIIAMAVHTGRILVLVSSPSFNQNAFVDGMSHEEWSRLATHPQRPMENKAIQGEYPPASVYKVVTAIAGLEEGIIKPDTTYGCPGFYAYGDRIFRCWKKNGHGEVDLVSALAESCDVFFYQLGQHLGVDRLAQYARSCGLGQPTGINLDGEANGLVPTSEWKKRRTGISWQGGDTLSVAIGQSYNLVTPIQVLVLTAAIANGGQRYQPMVLSSIDSPSGQPIEEFPAKTAGKLSAGQKTLDVVRQGMWRAVNTPSGTAYSYRLSVSEMSGKTGTAQLVSRKPGAVVSDEALAESQKAHAWFAAYAPAKRPEIAIVVFIEHGEHGSTAAAPIAKSVIETYFAMADSADVSSTKLDY
jgi:penicillin-binding protein 2